MECCPFVSDGLSCFVLVGFLVRRYLFNEGINPDTRASVEIENTALAVGLGRAATAREVTRGVTRPSSPRSCRLPLTTTVARARRWWSSQRNSITRARHDKQWVPPDPETARLYASYNHPRKGGEGGEKYNWRELTSALCAMIAACGIPRVLCVSPAVSILVAVSRSALCDRRLRRAARPLGRGPGLRVRPVWPGHHQLLQVPQVVCLVVRNVRTRLDNIAFGRVLWRNNEAS